MHQPRRLIPALILAAAAVVPATAGESQYEQEIRQLTELTSTRDLDVYELEFAPLQTDRIIVQDRAGGTAVFNYLVFRIRNQATDSTQTLQLRAKGYNEVLQSITKQFEFAKVESESGVRLTVDGVADKADAIILERQDSKPRKRSVNLHAVAFDERGSRMRLLDEKPGKGAQEAYAFPDLGNTRRSFNLASVREAIEKKVGRRLYTPEQIRTIALDPFDGVKRVEVDDITKPEFDRHGWYVGELYGVFIFDRFDDHGEKLTIQVHGMSNKLRTRAPAGPADKVANYAETRVARRTFVLHFDWIGDEYFRQDDSFTLTAGGWEWVDSFQRQARRADVAYAKYFLDNIQDGQGERKKDVEAEFWDYYNALRTSRAGSKHADKAPDLQKLTQER